MTADAGTRSTGDAQPEFLGARTEEGLFRFFGRNFYEGVVRMSTQSFVVGGVEVGGHEAAPKAWLNGVDA